MKFSPSLSKLTKSDKPQFVSLMSSAFCRDPLFLHVLGDSELDFQARSYVTAFVSFMFDKSFLLHEEVWGVFENEDLQGAYVVENPHANKLQSIRGGLLLIGRLLPLCFRMPRQTLHLLNSYMRLTRSFAPKLPHHYLIMIGVQPDHQGKGVGKALLNHLLHTVNKDPNSQGVALDTENKENVTMYQKVGFILNNETRLDDLPIYCMFYPSRMGK
ncbi:GNAT family N-acetyltransferase [Paenibacillus harenae]|uniref:GNAT family N-acetyltransferase n=1 Tax=Paenibacillus harenae TaxID=306543 RepID=UPI0027D782B4|nr:GNAT family N-acetyltransferase [Paenibacillus harenae]